MKTLFNLTNYPDPFTPGTHDVWLDSDRKQLVLETHFNDDIPGGSKDTEFINKSVKFISKLASENGIKRILDLACGPGRYSNKLASLKFNVTGIDYNSEALDLARKKAKNSNNVPDYYCYDLKSFSAPYDYDLCLLIYQVYGSFPYTDRKK
ncbi:class I SAM-dependent methyltransferase, partial [Staphylococcus simulans]|uniref:class I SAM-dependent methyltransferase n=1 Tax=Staphylococcus simulans TaxID=1286 RepID=UPI000D4E3EFB